MSGPFNAESLQEAALVERVEVHQELGSTSDRAKELGCEEAFAPTLVVTDRQTAGRGRGANRWHAGEGALTFSLLIRPADLGLVTEQQGLISIATAVALIDAARAAHGLDGRFKWPNDVWLNGKKLAGILLEAPRPGSLVIGVGVNANNRFDAAPVEIQAKAISLSEAASAEIDRQSLLLAFLAALNRRLGQLASNDLSPLDAARAACLLADKRVTLLVGERATTGLCRGLAGDGALLIESVNAVVPHYAGSIIEIGD